MNNIRSLNRKIDAMLIMIIAGLILGLALSYNYYQSRKTTNTENSEFAADLLAYSLPSEAASILEENIRRQPLSEKGLKMRKALADVYMNEMNDFDKALAQLLYINHFAANTEIASGTEEKIKYCMQRLGRVYDAERRNMMGEGINPIVNTVASDTVIQLGNKAAISVDELKMRMAMLGINASDMNKERVEQVVNQLAQELLLVRAAKRENLKNDPEIIANLRKIEDQVLMSAYLQKYILKDCKENDKEKRMQLLADAITELRVKEELKINSEVIDKAFGFANNTPTDSQTK